MEPEWYNSWSVLQKLIKFAQGHARNPSDIDNANQHQRTLSKRIQDTLKEQRPSVYEKLEIEQVGSSIEGVNVGKEIDFDWLLIVPASNIEPFKVANKPGHSYLKPIKESSGKCTENQYEAIQVESSDPRGVQEEYICAEKWSKRLALDLHLCLKKEHFHKTTIKLRKQGKTSLNLDIYEDENDEACWYTINMFPCFQFGIHERYVPKEKGDETILWRRNFSVEEKEQMAALELPKQNLTCRKDCLRILKLLRPTDAQLSRLSSYHFKTLLFILNREYETEDFWHNDQFVSCMMTFLQKLEDYLHNRNLPNYFMPSINLLEEMSSVTCCNIADRIKQIREERSAFEQLLT